MVGKWGKARMNQGTFQGASRPPTVKDNPKHNEQAVRDKSKFNPPRKGVTGPTPPPTAR